MANPASIKASKALPGTKSPPFCVVRRLSSGPSALFHDDHSRRHGTAVPPGKACPVHMMQSTEKLFRRKEFACPPGTRRNPAPKAESAAASRKERGARPAFGQGAPPTKELI